ncbi:MAG TPA: sulfotransferase, partial [Gammaproteobacteria bacterium]|nr:sulfotransferase [Gammaproteobacteria bacterium]
MAEASAAYAQGDLRRAGVGATRVLQQMPEMPEAMHLLGLCFLREGDAVRAVQLLRHAAALRPADAMLVHHLGIALQDAGDLAGALTVLNRAAVLDPRDVDVRLNIGVVSENAGDTAGAEQAYRDVLEREPRHAAAAAYLSSILEQRNSLEEAAVLSDRALEVEPREPVANLTRAQLDLRAGRMAEAAARLREVLADPALTPRNRAVAAGRLGAAYDRLGEPEAAWQQFMAAKKALQGTFASQPGGTYGIAAATLMHRYLDRLPDGLPPIQGTMPVFLVGFPRSGTTLLDQMLSGHPGIEVLEEKATLWDFLSEFAAGDAALERLARVGDAELEPWRRRYWQRVRDFMPGRDPQRLFVDKMPLNSLYMPLIHRLFPGARFLFALRDPRDVVLSCCMQTFTLNEAMRHFQSLDETARYYAAVMSVGAAAAVRLQDRVHLIHYEDVVADTESAARRLLEFLELPWEANVLDFQRTARAKRISTPSYHQVVEPIYTRARARWRRYEHQLAPVLPL